MKQTEVKVEIGISRDRNMDIEKQEKYLLN